MGVGALESMRSYGVIRVSGLGYRAPVVWRSAHNGRGIALGEEVKGKVVVSEVGMASREVMRADGKGAESYWETEELDFETSLGVGSLACCNDMGVYSWQVGDRK